MLVIIFFNLIFLFEYFSYQFVGGAGINYVIKYYKFNSAFIKNIT